MTPNELARILVEALAKHPGTVTINDAHESLIAANRGSGRRPGSIELRVHPDIVRSMRRTTGQRDYLIMVVTVDCETAEKIQNPSPIIQPGCDE